MPKSRVIYLKPSYLAVVIRTGFYDQSAPQAWSDMFDWLNRQAHNHSPGRGYGLAFDDPRLVSQADCRYGAAVQIPKTWRPSDEKYVNRLRFRGGAYAFRRHRASYAAIGSVIASVRDEWLPENGLSLDGSRPMVTIYYDDPLTVPENNLVADICVPVKQQIEEDFIEAPLRLLSA